MLGIAAGDHLRAIDSWRVWHEIREPAVALNNLRDVVRANVSRNFCSAQWIPLWSGLLGNIIPSVGALIMELTVFVRSTVHMYLFRARKDVV